MFLYISESFGILRESVGRECRLMGKIKRVMATGLTIRFFNYKESTNINYVKLLKL